MELAFHSIYLAECLQLACLRDVPNGLAPQLPDVEPLRDGEPLPLGRQEALFKGGLEDQLSVGGTVIPPETSHTFLLLPATNLWNIYLEIWVLLRPAHGNFCT